MAAASDVSGATAAASGAHVAGGPLAVSAGLGATVVAAVGSAMGATAGSSWTAGGTAAGLPRQMVVGGLQGQTANNSSIYPFWCQTSGQCLAADLQNLQDRTLRPSELEGMTIQSHQAKSWEGEGWS